jgi:hypothetical protein
MAPAAVLECSTGITTRKKDAGNKYLIPCAFSQAHCRAYATLFSRIVQTIEV